MKQLLLFLVGLSCSTVLVAQEAHIQFEHDTHKFKRLDPGPVLKHSFPFTNSGNAPLIITDVKVNCTCTKVRFPLQPVPAGGQDSVVVFFDTQGKIGYQDRSLFVHSNSVESPDKLRFKVFVNKP